MKGDEGGGGGGFQNWEGVVLEMGVLNPSTNYDLNGIFQT